MSTSSRLVTAEEFERFPHEPPYDRFELVEGRVIRMSPVSFEHGRVVMRLGLLLGRHLEQQAVGAIGADVGFKLASNPDTVRGPDIAFVRQDRVPPSGRGFFNGPPDLVIEVLSPDDRPGEVRAKTEQCLATGVAVVVIVDPEKRTTTTFRPGHSPLALASPSDLLDLSDAIAGFRCSLHEIFQ
jgi:Uma2 family endonuclease